MIPDLQLEHHFLSINLQFVTPLSPFSISPPYLAEAERFAETSYHQGKEKSSDAEDQEAIRWAATPTNTMITDPPTSQRPLPPTKSSTVPYVHPGTCGDSD